MFYGFRLVLKQTHNSFRFFSICRYITFGLTDNWLGMYTNFCVTWQTNFIAQGLSWF